MRVSALEICTYDLTGDARCGSAAKAALLHEDGEDDLASAALGRPDEPCVIRTGGVLRRTGLARHAHTRDIRRCARSGGNDPRHVPVDDARSGVVAVRHTFGLDVSSAIPPVVRTASTR